MKPFAGTCHLHLQSKGFPKSTEICGRMSAKVYTGHGIQTNVIEEIITHFTFNTIFPKTEPFMRYGKIWYSQTGHR
jgi:hypothetical protein